MKKIQILVALMIVVFVALCSGCDTQKNVSQNVSHGTEQSGLIVKMLDIGQGDAILIKTHDQVVLLDTGDIEQRAELVKKLKAEGITTIDKLIITHPHADHLGGAMGVLMNFDVKKVYDNGQITTTATYRKYIQKVTEKKIPYQQLLDGNQLDLGNGVQFLVYSPTKKMVETEGDLNNNSIVGKLVYGDFSVLFTGDCEAEGEKAILKKYGSQLKSTVLKSPHHGSKTSSNKEYLKMISPECVFISVGKDNDYKHPHEVTLNKYNKINAQVYRTDVDGTITLASDGHTYRIEKEK